MKKVSTQIYFQIFRAAVLYAVLSGLLFSCGEGIRLCPFPSPESSTTDQAILNLESEITYQFNAHRFEDHRKKSRSDFQTDGSPHFWINDGDSIRNSSLALATTKQNADNFSLRKILKFPLFSESGKSRAPPVTV